MYVYKYWHRSEDDDEEPQKEGEEEAKQERSRGSSAHNEQSILPFLFDKPEKTNNAK